MSHSHALDAIESFLEIEKRFLAFCNVVTYVPAHKRVHSPVLASLLLDCGSLSESIFKSAMDNARYNSILGIGPIRTKRYSSKAPFYNINDSRVVFRSDQLYAKKVWYIQRSDSSFPWYSWQKKQAKHPSWWKGYNSVKHDRFGNLADAKLETVMHAMQATFLILVQTLDFRKDLVELGIIRSRSIAFSTLLVTATHWEPFPVQDVVYAKSQAFGYKFKSLGSPGNATDISVFL